MRARRRRPAALPGGVALSLGPNAVSPISRSLRMLISPAHAQGLTGLMDQNALLQLLPLVLVFVVVYFLLIRPQQKKQKDHRTTLDALRRGDRIVTGGGIVGTVSKVVNPEEVEVDIAAGVRVRIVRSTIASVLAKPDPAAAREAARDRDAARDKDKDSVRREADKV
ncbi:MAG TPA: preprotein translocase subunit YajC [Stellaceae bacterium]|nr:preprotein translocase subunit YajC [Stellaceae bacterium]